jgi:catechol 2,3-dioxygenase-like lactoylglutathione lyase family enzyme
MDLRWDAVVVDCRDPDELARFWCALLGVQVRGRWEQYVGLHPMGEGQPRLVLQRTDDPWPAKNTLHLDLHVPSVAELPAAVERAVALGARAVLEHDGADSAHPAEDGPTWRTLADPEDNLFCLVAD